MSNDLNVLLSAYACRPNSGTEPGNGWNWAVHLARRGIRIHVLTVPEGREDIERFCAALPIPGLTFSYVEVPKRFRHTSRLHYVWWQCAAVKVARKVHHITPFDVAHHVTYSSIHVPTQLWRLGIPTIFGPVGGGQVTPFRMLPAFGAQRHSELLHGALTHLLPYSPFHRRWLQKMALILATNTDTLLLAKALANKQVEPWFDAALPLDFFSAAPRQFSDQQGPLRLFWIGRMVPRKALPLALDSLAKVTVPATLTIAGNGLSAEEFESLVSQRGLQGRVFWSGRRLDRNEVREAYSTHDALLFTSLRDSCPAQLVEAMGMGLPVITLDHHGARDLVPNGAGIKVAVSTVEQTASELAAAIDTYAASSCEEKTSMSRIGWTHARTLNYADGAALLEGLYRQIKAGSRELKGFPSNARHLLNTAVGAKIPAA